ncbi:hypothetical protein BLA13014_00741 [Burkholderia aenigmatica]|uniref:Uncharacterized protein n=1 Tax=Burkholderia aenigmatica TaxID=2015348 RepID=A0A6P2HY34_9BURK|nr:hypothetical protein BLA13014_00741 [Burkholderia aenigmatica]
MRLWHRRLRPSASPIGHCPRAASRSARAAAKVLVAPYLDMNSVSRTGMNICARTARGRLPVAVRMRRSGRTTRRVVRMARRIRSILRCRSRSRGRSTTTARGRVARPLAVRGRRGRPAISPGDALGRSAAAASSARHAYFPTHAGCHTRVQAPLPVPVRFDWVGRLDRGRLSSALRPVLLAQTPHQAIHTPIGKWHEMTRLEHLKGSPSSWSGSLFSRRRNRRHRSKYPQGTDD